MQIENINSFSSFCKALHQAGFAMGGSNSEGIFSLAPYFENNIKYHTSDMETDPWEWRMRVLNECDDIAYSKLFFSKSGYITKEWYPYFLAARRNGQDFEQVYRNGVISNNSKRIYDVVCEHNVLPLHEIKRLGGFNKDENSKFERALIELQMGMYITMCGSSRKISQKGKEFGWSVTMFCTTESFFDAEVSSKAQRLSQQEAISKITDRILELNPYADENAIVKFIRAK